MNITSLLNPETEEHPVFATLRRSSSRTRASRQHNTANIKSDPFDDLLSDEPIMQKKYKDAKDAPKFERGDPRGNVLYPPYEADTQDTEIMRQYKKFGIFPCGDISLYPRHIPYTSEKKSFLARTGKSGFEVYHYSFRDSKEVAWTVMWDYNDGLVRITPFFKCLSYGKTVPAKAIGASPGLKDLCYSVTGGALAAQGYWMPFEAAKALAATFCWEIRYALTPIFGPAFISQCTHPNDPAFKRYTIDPSIIRACAAQRRSNTTGNAARKVSHPKQKKPQDVASNLPEPPAPRILRTRRTSAMMVESSSDSDAIRSDTSADDDEARTTPSSPTPPSNSTSSWNAVNRALDLPRKNTFTPALSSASAPSGKRTRSDSDDGEVSAASSSSAAAAASAMDETSRPKKTTMTMMTASRKFPTSDARAAQVLLDLAIADAASVKRRV